MTEIQWLVDVMLHCKLSADVRERFIARIGEVESSLTRSPQPVQAARPSPTAQAPSTQRILDDMAQTMPPSLVNNFSKPPPAAIDKETGRPMVATGKGTLGPRKF